MIHSSAIEGHHFLHARRRGYEPTEVDAVIKRIVATLRKYEEQTAMLADPAGTGDVADLEEVETIQSHSVAEATQYGSLEREMW